VFYDAEWQELGSKEELSVRISEITTIDNIILQQEDAFRKCSVAEKMSWAARRKCTRIEDESYCLLGLFEVNMPLLYGEGQSAFLRLQEEIIKVSGDQSIFAFDFSKQTIDLSARECQQSNASPFAHGPSAFLNSKGLVPTAQWEVTEPFQMTNIGLQIPLRIVTLKDGRLVALLGCGFRGDESYCVAMFLERTSSSNHFLRRGRSSDLGNEVFHTILLPLELAYGTTVQTVYLDRGRNHTIRKEFLGPKNDDKILVSLKSDVNALDYGVVRVLPDHCTWNEEFRLITFSRALYRETPYIMVILRSRETEPDPNELAVFIELPNAPNLGNKSIVPVKSLRADVMQSGNTCFSHQSTDGRALYADSDLFEYVDVYNTGVMCPCRLSATLSTRRVLNKVFFYVEISFDRRHSWIA
jgi:hypothetical protein